jgi:hypothetical protein
MYSLLARSELVAGDTVDGEAFVISFSSSYELVLRRGGGNTTRFQMLVTVSTDTSVYSLNFLHAWCVVACSACTHSRRTERVIVIRPVGGWPHSVLRTFLHVVIGVVVEARADGSSVCMSVVSFGVAARLELCGSVRGDESLSTSWRPLRARPDARAQRWGPKAASRRRSSTFLTYSDILLSRRGVLVRAYMWR